MTPLALLGLCLPPRRLDLRATILGGVALWGTNQLTHDYSGKSFTERFSARMASLTGSELPEKARATQARLREEKELRTKLRALRDEMVRSGNGRAGAVAGPEGMNDEEKKVLVELLRKQLREEAEQAGQGNETAERGLLGKIWMGDAEPDWKEKRIQRERAALREGGGGYWGLISDQIAEVWSGGKKNEGDGSKEKTDGGDDARKS